MGSPSNERQRSDRERLHKVVLTSGFWLSQYELTQSEWSAVMGSNPSTHISGVRDVPVENIDWTEAGEFCSRLTDRERARGTLPPGWEYALPTEAQWEYACRAGTATAYSFGDDPALLHRHGNYSDKSAGYSESDMAHDDGQRYHTRVGSYAERETRPNAWGFYDMHGNVSELCADALDSNLLSTGDQAVLTDPLGTQGNFRVNRGGGYLSSASQCRSASRSVGRPSSVFASTGFRPAVVPSRPPVGGVAPEKESGSEPGTKR